MLTAGPPDVSRIIREKYKLPCGKKPIHTRDIVWGDNYKWQVTITSRYYDSWSPTSQGLTRRIQAGLPKKKKKKKFTSVPAA